MMSNILKLYFILLFHLISGSVDDVSHPPTMVELTDWTFAETVSKGAAPWLVLVYCGNTTFATTALENFKIAANLLKIIYNFGYLDYSQNVITNTTFRIITYDDATLFIFGDDRTNPRLVLQGGISWETSNFIKEGLKAFDDILQWRLENFNIESNPKKKPLVLNSNNFRTKVKIQEINGTYAPWIILFYSDENLESLRLKETFEMASAKLYPKIQSGTVDVAKEYKFASNFFDILFLPTIMYIGKVSSIQGHANPELPMPEKPTIAQICNFALTERLMDISSFKNYGVPAVVIALGDVPYNQARVLHFGGNTTIHLFTRL